VKSIVDWPHEVSFPHIGATNVNRILVRFKCEDVPILEMVNNSGPSRSA
jgi:hypothetical protein